MKKTPLLALSACLLAASSWADPVAEACRLLRDARVAAALPGARALLCEGKTPACATKPEATCEATLGCTAQRGSSSGPGCSPCTPDMAFRACEAAPRANVAASVLEFERCRVKQGRWAPDRQRPPGHCNFPTGTVTGQVLNTGVNVSVYFNDQLLPDAFQQGGFTMGLDANTPTRIRVVDNATTKSITHTVTVKPDETVKVVFRF